MSSAQNSEGKTSVGSSGKPDAGKLARPVWGWGRGAIPRPTPRRAICKRLKREGKYQEDEFNALAQKRQSEIVGPVYSEVLKTLGEYVKSKDFGLLFDASKDQSGMLIYASEKYDITKEFITYYNTRPVTAIAPVPR